MGAIMVSFIILCSFSLWAQTPPIEPINPNDAVAIAAQAKKNAVLEPTEIQSFLAPFYYDRERFRDPFEAQGSGNPLSPGQVYGPFLQMQTYNLSEFQLKGLLWNTDKPVAVFKAPDGKEHRLKVKDYIGENFGYIASIREKEVVVIQTIEEDNKRYSTTKVVFLQSKTQ
jgi:Tfp pilus assembly protein PilP